MPAVVASAEWRILGVVSAVAAGMTVYYRRAGLLPAPSAPRLEHALTSRLRL
jgi:hypothetical protein